jgi:hypothetical protein
MRRIENIIYLVTKKITVIGLYRLNIKAQMIFISGNLIPHLESIKYSRNNMAYISREKFLATKDPSGYRYQEQHFDGTHSEWLEYIKGSRLGVEFSNLQLETKALLLAELTERLVTLSVKSAPACKLLLDVLGDSNSVGRPRGKKVLSDEHLDNIRVNELAEFTNDIQLITKSRSG